MDKSALPKTAPSGSTQSVDTSLSSAAAEQPVSSLSFVSIVGVIAFMGCLSTNSKIQGSVGFGIEDVAFVTYNKGNGFDRSLLGNVNFTTKPTVKILIDPQTHRTASVTIKTLDSKHFNRNVSPKIVYFGRNLVQRASERKPCEKQPDIPLRRRKFCQPPSELPRGEIVESLMQMARKCLAIYHSGAEGDEFDNLSAALFDAAEF